MKIDSGILDDKTEKELEEYMENLGLRFEFGCQKEKNPQSCHSYAQWLESYKKAFSRSAEALRENCFNRKYGDSCLKYGFFKLFGKEGVQRDSLAAFHAFEFGCQSGDHGKCCQSAGRLIAEGIVSHSPLLSGALPLFERGCQLGLGESCFHLGGASIALANQTLQNSSKATSGADTPDSLRVKAVKAWSEGCRLGHEFSCRNMARAYTMGDGVTVDKVKATEFLKLAERIATDKGILKDTRVTQLQTQ